MRLQISCLMLKISYLMLKMQQPISCLMLKMLSQINGLM